MSGALTDSRASQFKLSELSMVLQNATAGSGAPQKNCFWLKFQHLCRLTKSIIFFLWILLGKLQSSAPMGSFVRISALLWADVFVEFALFVMQDYLTDVWDLSITHAAGIVNLSGGIAKVLPVFFLVLADALTGNFWVLLFSSVAYSAGIGFVWLSTPPILSGATNTCEGFRPECVGGTQKALFYSGMALLAVGIAGHETSLKPFLDEQGDQNREENRPIQLGGRNAAGQVAGFTLVVIVALIGAFGMSFIRPWPLRFGIPALVTVVATILFLTCSCTYRRRDPQGSPIARIFKVLIVAACNIFRNRPLDATDLRRDDDQAFSRTRFLRCLEKAAIESPDDQQWKLCTVGDVEEAKIAVRMIPMLLTFVFCGVVSSSCNTYFVEQAKNMNPYVGKLRVPTQVLLVVFSLAKFFFLSRVDKFFESPRKSYASSVGIGVAMTFSVLCCVTAASVEGRRLRYMRSHDQAPTSMFWLVPQFVLLGGLDTVLERSVSAFFMHQSPETMSTVYLEGLAKGVMGTGYMFGVLLVIGVGRGFGAKWFRHTLNDSRLDLYYWLLAACGAVDLVLFVVVACCYTYKSRQEQEQEAAAVGATSYESNDANGAVGKLNWCC